MKYKGVGKRNVGSSYGRKIINVWRTSRRVEWLVYGVSYDICPLWYLDGVERYGVPWRFD